MIMPLTMSHSSRVFVDVTASVVGQGVHQGLQEGKQCAMCAQHMATPPLERADVLNLAPETPCCDGAEDPV